MDSVESASAPPKERERFVAERDRLRNESEEASQRAQQILEGGRVSPWDANFRSVMLTRGNIIFGREVGATNEEKKAYYGQALAAYQEASELFPDDPRPFLYQGLCHERLAGIAQSLEEKQKEFALGKASLDSALERSTASEDYDPSLPYRALASLYMHVNDYRSALDALRNAQRLNPESAAVSQIQRDIQSLEQYLGQAAPR